MQNTVAQIWSKSGHTVNCQLFKKNPVHFFAMILFRNERFGDILQESSLIEQDWTIMVDIGQCDQIQARFEPYYSI